MATSALVATNNIDSWYDGKRAHYIGTLAIAAGDYTTGGIAVNFKSDGKVKSSRAPIWVDLKGKAGYTYRYIRSSGKVMIFHSDLNGSSDGPDIELPTAAMPDAVVADIIEYHVIFPAGV